MAVPPDGGDMGSDLSGVVAEALETAMSVTYDRVAVSRDSVLHSAAGYHGFKTWDDYQREAGLRLMDEIADAQIRRCKLTVTGFGAVAGLGGLATLVPDTLQFVALTLRMVTGIAAAYGFDPDPYSLKGKVKVLVLQAYLNANLGQTPVKGIEAVTLAATTRLLRNAATRADFLVRLIILIGRVLGVRITRQGLLRSIPVLSSGANAAFNWFYARQIAQAARREFRQFREDLRHGKYAHDPAFEGLGG